MQKTATYGVGGISSRVKGIKILIIDNDPAKLDALASFLRSIGASVAVGGRGKSGYTQASLLTPDVIISDLISPGEPGWKLVQDVRRHPILRWTPFVLVKWWEEKDKGMGHVLKEKLLERIEEALAPVYLIDERIRTNRPLGGHVTSIGPIALIRLLVQKGLIGTLTVNDGWSVFQVKTKKNKLHSVYRSDAFGINDEGFLALLQLMLCDSGKWSFAIEKDSLSKSNIEPDLEVVVQKAGSILGELFNRGLTSGQSGAPLKVRMDMLDSIEPALPLTAHQIIDVFKKRSDEQEISSLIKDLSSKIDLEQMLRMFVRIGFIVPMAIDETAPPNNRSIAEENASHLFSALSPVLSIPPKNVSSSAVWKDEQGSSIIDDISQESKDPNTETLILEGFSSPFSITDKAPEPLPLSFKSRMVAAVAAGSAFVSSLQQTITDIFAQDSSPLLGKLKNANYHKWLAIAISVILGALMIIGLFAIASSK